MMKKLRNVLAAALVGCGILALPLIAEDNPEADLDALVGKVQAKINQGSKDAAAYQENLEAFDALLKKYEGQKTDEVARIQLMKAMLYVQILEDTDKGFAELRTLIKNFPGTESAESAEGAINHFEMQSKLAIGKPFPDFEAKDLEGDPLSVSKYKGKVVLVDFWATWCGPCVQELPHVLEAYEAYHDKGFDIIGISLDQSESALKKFIKREDMPWQQYFDGKGWSNDLAKQYGVRSIPATFLIDREGNIAAKDLRGDALKQTVAKLLASK